MAIKLQLDPEHLDYLMGIAPEADPNALPMARPAGQPFEPTPRIGAAAAPEFRPEGAMPAPPPTNVPKPTEKESRAAGRSEFKAGMPTVTEPAGTPGFYGQKLAKLEYEKAHPWGSPVSAQPGFLGKVGHIAAKVGNIAGDIVAPNTMSLIPGTDLNRNIEEKSLIAGKQRAEKAEEEKKAAESEREARAATTKETGARTNLLETQEQVQQRHMKMLDEFNAALQSGKDPFATLGELSDTEKMMRDSAIQESRLKGDMTPILQVGEKIATLRATEDRAGKTAAQDKQAFEATMQKAIQAAGPGFDPNTLKDQNAQMRFLQSSPALTPEEKSKASAYMTANITPGANVTRMEILADPRWAMVQQGAAKMAEHVYENVQDAQRRLGVMAELAPEAKAGNQQAMVALLANHVNMTLRQAGSTVTLEHWKEAQQSAPWLQRVEARFDKNGYLTGTVLTPDQIDQMLQLGKQQYQWAVGQARSTADQLRQMGVQVNEPPQFAGPGGEKQFTPVGNTGEPGGGGFAEWQKNKNKGAQPKP